MAGLRKGHSYTTVKRAYTRKSKFKKKGYIKAAPAHKIVKFDMGDLQKDFPCQGHLIPKQDIQIRHNALESARIVVNRSLNKSLGNNYRFKVRLFPHHVLRENKMLTGAGADRMQSGMQRSFGKAIGVAAQVRIGRPIFTAYVDLKDRDAARLALKKAYARLPGRCTVLFEQ